MSTQKKIQTTGRPDVAMGFLVKSTQESIAYNPRTL